MTGKYCDIGYVLHLVNTNGEETEFLFELFIKLLILSLIQSLKRKRERERNLDGFILKKFILESESRHFKSLLKESKECERPNADYIFVIAVSVSLKLIQIIFSRGSD